MKRTVSLTLLFAILLTASCGSNSAPEVTTAVGTDSTTAAAETDRLDELGDKNFGGRTFTILDANDHPDMHVNIPEDSMNGDIINDALYERDNYISERYGVDFEYVTGMNGRTGMESLKQTVLAGDDAYTMAIAPLLGGAIGAVALEGVLYDLASNDYLSLDQNWWSHLIYDHLRLGGKMYYTTGDISPTMYQMPACIFLNTRLAADYGINTDFCGLVRSGKWTVDELIAVNKDMYTDVNGDNVMDLDDTYGFIHHTLGGFITNCLLTTEGVDLATVNGSELTVDIMNERTVNVIEKLKNIIVDIKYSDSNDLLNKTFKEGRALMAYHYVESASQRFRDMKDDFLILPMPKYDEEQDDYHSFVNTWADAFVAIPTTADPEFAGFVTEALAFWSYKNIRTKAYDVTYKAKTSRDENSAEMLDYIFNNLYIDFNCIYDFGGTAAALTNVLNGNAGLASELAAIKDKTEADIESFTKSWLGE